NNVKLSQNIVSFLNNFDNAVIWMKIYAGNPSYERLNQNDKTTDIHTITDYTSLGEFRFEKRVNTTFTPNVDYFVTNVVEHKTLQVFDTLREALDNIKIDLRLRSNEPEPPPEPEPEPEPEIPASAAPSITYATTVAQIKASVIRSDDIMPWPSGNLGLQSSYTDTNKTIAIEGSLVFTITSPDWTTDGGVTTIPTLFQWYNPTTFDPSPQLGRVLNGRAYNDTESNPSGGYFNRGSDI
ncbi:MAG: hypothetical protein VX026_14190, partial [Myxococcota bacterium]|nr:hypothetical protein [Myxococcota bacterium]